MSATAIKHCASCSQPIPADRKLSLCPTCLTRGWQRAREDAPSTGTGFEIPGHEILGELARGGMGIVYHARQQSPQREVAVKMLMPQLALEDLRERFRIEAKVMAGLVHPGIMPIYQYGEHNGVPWISMALCGRGSLAARKDEYRGQWRAIAELLARLAEAVAFAHAHGVLHRDLKPGNVLFDDEGRVFLSDFGLAKIISEQSDLTRPLSLVGTPHYLAPELISNAAQATTASDVYALGAILHELLAGKAPFDGENIAAILKQISESEPAPMPAAVPRDLATIALKCLHKSPAQRYITAQALADDLQRWLKGEPVTARRMSTTERFTYWCRRKPALAAVSLLLGLSLLVATLVTLKMNSKLTQSLHQADVHRREALLGEAQVIRRQVAVLQTTHGLQNIAEIARTHQDDELREEAAALLSLPSVNLRQTSSGRTHLWAKRADPQLRYWADFISDESAVCVTERASGHTLARLAPGDFMRPMEGSPFDPSGEYLCYAQDKQKRVVVMRWRTGECLLSLPFSEVRWPVMRSGAEVILVKGGQILHYDLRELGKVPRVWEMPAKLKKPALSKLSPDEKWLGVGDEESNALFVFDVAAGKVRAEYQTVSRTCLSAMGWSGTGEAFVAGTLDGLFNGFLNDPARLSRRVLPDHYGYPRAISWHPRGDLLVTVGEDNRTQLLHTATLRPMGVLAASGFQTQFFDEGGQLLVENSRTAQEFWYEVQLSKVCREYAPPDTMSGGSHSWGGDGITFICEGRMLLVKDGIRGQLFDVATGKRLARLTSAGSMNVWNEATHELWLSSHEHGDGWTLTEEREGNFVLKQDHDIDIRGIMGPRESGEPGDLASALPSEKTWMLHRAGEYVFVDTTSTVIGKCAVKSPAGKSVIFHPHTESLDGKWLLQAGAERGGGKGVLLMMDVAKRMPVKLLELPRLAAFTVAADQTSVWLADGKTLRKVSTQTWQDQLVVPCVQTDPTLRAPAASPDGRLLATLDDRTLHLRDARTGRCFLKLRHPLAIPISAATFSPDSTQLACACLGQMSHVWDLHELMTEFRRLGLAWPGPEMPQPKPQQAVKSVRLLLSSR